MKESLSSNKTIAKNTVLLYARMLVTMLVGLYTSRVVLRVLGVSDYGVYNVVGGFVAMLSYLKTAFVGGTQRFTAFALGQDDIPKLKSVFNNSIIIFILLSLLIVLVAESFGLWFVNNKLTIDENRMLAANWVYQCSLISLVFTLLSVTYNASIIAHEHMQIYAYVCIVETFLKLGIVFLLVLAPYDKLIFYSILNMLISCVVFLFYRYYCRQHFQECRYCISFDKGLFREMFSYSGWHLVGNLGFTFKDQFSNIILNIFLGTSINAARGLAGQVNGAITSFSDNLMMAITPPITKEYAAGNIDKSQKLVYAGSRYSTYLMALVAIPLILNIDFILDLWLDEVPPFTSELAVITLVASMFYAMSKTTSVGIQATGKIRAFQIGVAIIMLLELPVAYWILKQGYSPIWAVVPSIVTNIIGFFFRVYILKKLVPSYSIRSFITSVFIRCILVVALCYFVGYAINSLYTINLWTCLMSSIIFVILSGLIMFFFGINKEEKEWIVKYIKLSILKK